MSDARTMSLSSASQATASSSGTQGVNSVGRPATGPGMTVVPRVHFHGHRPGGAASSTRPDCTSRPLSGPGYQGALPTLRGEVLRRKMGEHAGTCQHVSAWLVEWHVGTCDHVSACLIFHCIFMCSLASLQVLARAVRSPVPGCRRALGCPSLREGQRFFASVAKLRVVRCPASCHGGVPLLR